MHNMQKKTLQNMKNIQNIENMQNMQDIQNFKAKQSTLGSVVPLAMFL